MSKKFFFCTLVNRGPEKKVEKNPEENGIISLIATIFLKLGGSVDSNSGANSFLD